MNSLSKEIEKLKIVNPIELKPAVNFIEIASLNIKQQANEKNNSLRYDQHRSSVDIPMENTLMQTIYSQDDQPKPKS